jgi:hypothetical protein
MWLMTYDGLSLYDINRDRFRNFYSEDGLSHNEFNRLAYYRDDNGITYMGGMNGLNRFDPSNLIIEEDPARLLICEATYYSGGAASIDHRYFGLNDVEVFEIPSNSRSFSLKLALSDYNNPKSNTFAYLLEDMSYPGTSTATEWKSAGLQRELTFDYLPPGRYLLKIQAYSAKGTRAANNVGLILDVADAFYKSYWFISLCVVLTSGILYGLYRYRLMQVLRLEELRTQISNDLHDDVGGVLSGIAYQMELLEYSVDDPLKGLVSGIKEASRKAVLRMRDAVWAIDADNDSYREMEDRMKRFAQEMLEPQNIHWSFRTDNLLGKYTLSSDVRHHLLLIFKEFVTNTVKHASASEVLIHITRHGKWLNMHLQDNGTGLTQAEHADGRGLSNIRKRAEQMRAKLEFINSNGFGLRLTVKAF